MTPELIALLLRQPLPVRLALLDAGPAGAGWLVPVGASEAGNCYVAMRVTPYERGQVRDGAAWLPCNPLAIVRHALKLAGDLLIESDIGLTDVSFRIRRRAADAHKLGRITRARVSASLDRDGPMWEHTAAVALLREVVG